jgi:hypothetical protein
MYNLVVMNGIKYVIKSNSNARLTFSFNRLVLSAELRKSDGVHER